MATLQPAVREGTSTPLHILPGAQRKPANPGADRPKEQPAVAAPAAPAPAPAPAPDPAPQPNAGTQTNAQSLQARLNAEFPWLARLGLGLSWFQEQAAQVTTDDEMLGNLRQTNQYKALFPAILRDDGTMRADEATYLRTNDDYKTLLKQFGRPDQEYDNPSDYVGLWQNEIHPDELKQRLTMWDTLDKGSDDIKNDFYVYAGMKLSTDDLYAATTNPEAQRQLLDEYNNRVSAQPLDYQTFITRATEAGLGQVSKTLSNLQQNGAVTGTAVSTILQTNPAFAQQMMDVLYHGGEGAAATRTLNLQELTNAFQYAMLGSAATQNGLNLPDKARVEAIRQAGIERTQALQTYADFAKNKGIYDAAVQRATGQSFGQDDFEKAAFLQQADSQLLLQKGLGSEKAMGQKSGSFAFSSQGGQLTQSGFNSRP
jgi:hypothetical protein